MKFFPEFGSCLGGAIATPAAGDTGVRHHTEEDGGDFPSHARRTSKRSAKLSGAAAHWKPKLNAISENSPMSDAARGGGIRRTSGIDEKRRPVKAKPKSPVKAAPPPSFAEDYWQFSQTMALPAFSPTSYLF
ncbi:hypothetical protein C2S52_013631 [Perilla frutescens var. hirtella]|uniref:Uncharacterized protein n=1 Tax=Perilla frutescens var. hirtella TaxID=608512 RepID=A0AAD4JHY2_PERFH|nr:hypothetical protein C2S52_013631 [Perilla frutescens var. hirtella]KAH6834179.1 hypothetical protein C2S53_019937 [Perilla frutescens var. hirtella]